MRNPRLRHIRLDLKRGQYGRISRFEMAQSCLSSYSSSSGSRCTSLPPCLAQSSISSRGLCCLGSALPYPQRCIACRKDAERCRKMRQHFPRFNPQPDG